MFAKHFEDEKSEAQNNCIKNSNKITRGIPSSYIFFILRYLIKIPHALFRNVGLNVSFFLRRQISIKQ